MDLDLLGPLRTVMEPWMAMARQTSSVEYGKDMVTRLARRFMVDCLVVWLLVRRKREEEKE